MSITFEDTLIETLKKQVVANSDIGFVKLGQETVIKVDAFLFARFGVLNGKEIQIASEAVDEQEAKRVLANVTSTISSRSRA